MKRSCLPLHPRLTSTAALLALALFAPDTARADAGGASGVTEVVSLDSTGQFSAGNTIEPSISEDGRYVAFASGSALLPEDTNTINDVYVLDRWTGTLVCASTTVAGIYGDHDSGAPRISADGRWVVFHTEADNLLPLDNNGGRDVYRKDLWTGALVRVSNIPLSPVAANSDSQYPTVSDDGRYVAFESFADDHIASDTNGQLDVFVRDMDTGVTQRVSEGILGEGNGGSGEAMISGDGTRVVFTSEADNLVLFDLNGVSDVFLAPLGMPLRLVSQSLAGQPGNGPSGRPSISSDGTVVAFESSADDLLASDINGTKDIFVFYPDTFTMELASLTSWQAQASSARDARVSRDGLSVAFEAGVDFAPFSSPFFDIYLRDLVQDKTWTLSRPSGTVGSSNQQSRTVAVAQGGAVVAFASQASNLAPGDTNGKWDIFVRTTHPDPLAYCTSSTTAQGCEPSLSTDGFPSVSSGEFFTIIGSDMPNQRSGLLFYGFNGATATPFAGATMCVAGTKKRTPLTNTSGTPPGTSDCTGYLAFDMNGFAAGLGGGNPRPELSLVGQQVNVQFWGRDPLGPGGSFLSSAVQYVVGP